jgi:hypothetical protein
MPGRALLVRALVDQSLGLLMMHRLDGMLVCRGKQELQVSMAMVSLEMADGFGRLVLSDLLDSH